MAAKTERFEARLEPEQRALLEEAAAARGQSLSAFMVGAALVEAKVVVQSSQVTLIPSEFAATFTKLLEAPPGALAPNFRRLADYEPLAESAPAAPSQR
jgi:uncharacterized protein (DUF1778 family)